jgi:hypothetical protein
VTYLKIFKNEMGAACGTYWRREVHAGLWWEDPREREHLEVLGVYGRTVCKGIFKKCGAEAWTGLIWLRKGTDGGAFGFHKMRGIS